MLQRASVNPANSVYAHASAQIDETLRQAGGYLRAAAEIQRLTRSITHYAAPAAGSLGEMLLQKITSL
jgi:hypothetical protein